MTKILESTILAEEITSYFEDVIGGMYSDIAWYELLVICDNYKHDIITEKRLLDYLEFTFGFDGQKDLDNVIRKSNKRYNKLAKMVN